MERVFRMTLTSEAVDLARRAADADLYKRPLDAMDIQQFVFDAILLAIGYTKIDCDDFFNLETGIAVEEITQEGGEQSGEP